MDEPVNRHEICDDKEGRNEGVQLQITTDLIHLKERSFVRDYGQEDVRQQNAHSK